MTIYTHSFAGYDKATVELLRGSSTDDGNDDTPEDFPIAPPGDDRPDDWVDEDMPVDQAFVDAMHDISELHRCVINELSQVETHG